MLTSYDSRAGSPGAEANATGLAATLAAAQALAGDKPEVNVHFVFLPHANDPESPVLETAAKFDGNRRIRQKPCSASKPWARARNSGSARGTPPPRRSLSVQGLGAVHGAEVVCLGEDMDLASMLFEMNLPAVRVATRPLVTARRSGRPTARSPPPSPPPPAAWSN